MRISRVYFGAEFAEGDVVTLDKTQIHYLKHVLRLKSGASVILFNGRQSLDYHASLSFSGKSLQARIESSTLVDTESSLDSEIIQGLARADHIDWMIQKSTELGVKRIRVFNAQRSQLPLKAAQQQKKLAHWQAVAISACEQCGRAIMPQISFCQNLSEALQLNPQALKLLLDFDAPALTTMLQPPQSSVSILVGPEGGLNPAEIEAAAAAGFAPASLGKRILRTETAAVAALTLAQSSLGDLG